MTISVDDLRERYTYDPIKGEIWTRRHKDARYRDPTLLQPQSTCTVRYEPIFVAVIAFVLHHGRFPVGELDHCDRNRDNIKADNLREATPAQNKRNQARRSSSGLKGVSWDKQRQLWRAQIRDDRGTKVNLGRFPTKDAAHQAYVRAAKLFHKEFMCLEVRP